MRANIPIENDDNCIMYTAMKFGDVSAMWLEEQKDVLAKTTYEKYESQLRKYLLPLIKDEIVGDISENDITQFLKDIFANSDGVGKNGGKLKSSSLYFLRVVVHRVLEFARDKDFPREEEIIYWKDKVEYQPLSEKEIVKLCKCAKYNKSPEMLAVMLMLFCGVRLGEVCALNCKDIDLVNKKIYIHQSVHRIRNINEDNSETKTKLVIEEIPSPSQIRTVEIPDKLINYIKDFYNPGMMLLTGTPDRPMEARTLKNRFDRLLAEYHMENIPFQRLRKTYIQDKTKIEALDKVF